MPPLVAAPAAKAAQQNPGDAERATIEVHFAALRDAIAKNDSKAIDLAFAETMQRKLAAGWPNAFAFAALLGRDARELANKGNIAQALRVAEYARDLAPSSLATRALLLRLRSRMPDKDWGTVFREAWTMSKVACSDFLSAAGLAADAAAALIFVLFLLPACLLALLAVQKLRYVAHDLHLLLPSGVPLALSYAIIAVVAAVPLALHLGFLTLVFPLLLISFFHLELSDRLIATACALVLAVSPLLVPGIVDMTLLPSGRAADLYALTRAMASDGMDADAAEIRISHELARKDSAESRVALGLYALRSLDFSTARHHFERATELDAKREDAWVDLGAALAAENKFDEAQEAFEHVASDKNSRNIPGLFNLARMYYRNAGHDSGNQAYNRAQALRPELTHVLLATSRLIGPRFVAQQTLPATDLWNASPYAGDTLVRQRLIGELEPHLTGPIPALSFLIAAAIWILMLSVAGVFVRRLVPSIACPRCGRPICIHTDKDLPDRSLCGQCYHAFVKGDVDSATKIAKELECLRYERRQNRAARVLSLLLAGAGHVWIGKTRAGLPWMIVASVAMVALLFCANILPAPVRMGEPLLASAGVYSALAIWAFVLIMSFLTVRRET